MKNSEMLKFVPDHLKTKKMSNHAATKLPLIVHSYHHVLEFVLKYYKTQKICDEDVSTYPLRIKFVPEWLMTQEMCDKPVNRCLFLFDSIPTQYQTQEMCKSMWRCNNM